MNKRINSAITATALVLALALSCFVQPAWAQTIKIMPFGDAETIGRWGKVGYRYPLWYLLNDAGFSVDFVGTITGTAGEVDLGWYPEYNSSFDRDHQGAFFAETDALLLTAESVAAIYRPDVVLLMAGMADVWYGGAGGVLKAKTNLPNIIAAFRASVPNVTILLSQVPPFIQYSAYPVLSENRIYIEPLNEAIGKIAGELNTAESPIHLIDNYTGFDPDTMFCCRDQMLPDPDGEAWIANNFFQVLESVLPDIETSSFLINSGLSDAWYNPATSGQGFLITVFPDRKEMFLAWFTFDTERPQVDVSAVLGEPGHRWLTAQGSYSGDTANLTIFVTKGGVFDAAEPAVTTDLAGDGTMKIEFADCENGLVSYEIGSLDISGEIPIQRITDDNVALCAALSADD